MTSSDGATGGPPPDAGDRELRAVVDSIPGIVGFWGTDQRNRFGNRAYADFFGLSPERLHGMHYSELIGPAAYEELLPHIAQALAGVTTSVDRDFVDHLGQSRRVRAHYSPVLLGGRVQGFTVLVVDITAQFLAERSAQERAAAAARLDQQQKVADAAHRSVLQDLFAATIEIDRLESRARQGGAGADRDALVAGFGPVADLITRAIGALRRLSDVGQDDSPT